MANFSLADHHTVEWRTQITFVLRSRLRSFEYEKTIVNNEEGMSMETMKRKRYFSCITTGALGLALIGLAACNSGEATSTTPAPTPSSSAGLTNPLVLINNTGDKTLETIKHDGDTNNQSIGTLGGNNEFQGTALGDMTSSAGDWVFMNLSAANGVALIDPLSGAKPIFETILPTGERPVHIYRDAVDGEVIWSMNDGNATTGIDSINCSAQAVGSVSVLHNSHLGPGGEVPKLQKTLCLGVGHKVAAFSKPTASDATIPKRTFITNAKSGEMSVIDNNAASPATYLTIIKNIDLCDSAKETTPCDSDVATPNASSPHGIAWSNATGKVYSRQEGYENVVEVDPDTMQIVRKVEVAPFTSSGISPDGKFLFLRATDKTTDPDHVLGKLGVIDLTANPLAVTPLPDLQDIAPGSFKFSPDGTKLYLTQSNDNTGLTAAQQANLKRDKLVVLDTAALPAAPTVTAEISLLPSPAGHSLDLHVHDGNLKHLWVTNKDDNSVSVINAASNQLVQRVAVGSAPGGLMVYESSALAGGHH
jgi:YVTN family beta-propeller protein